MSWKPKRPVQPMHNRQRDVYRYDGPHSTGKDGRYQAELTQVMRATDAQSALLVVQGGNKGTGMQYAAKAEHANPDEVPRLLRAMLAKLEGDILAGNPQRAKAHEIAEREICNYARRPDLLQQAAERGRSPIDQGIAIFSAGFKDIHARLQTGEVTAGDMLALGALCIELFRECLLDNAKCPEPSDDEIAEPDATASESLN